MVSLDSVSPVQSLQSHNSDMISDNEFHLSNPFGPLSFPTSESDQVPTKGLETTFAHIPRTWGDHHGILRLWTAGGHKFAYGTDGQLAGPLSAKEVNTFITSRGWSGVDRSLDITIQRCPRLPNTYMFQQPQCVFKECPLRRLENNDSTAQYIQEDDYMLAFDELIDYRSVGGTKIDPYIVSGYAHLYCAERWLDFPELCMIADLHVRPICIHCPYTPDGHNVAALDEAAQAVAEKWLAETRRHFARPADYPSRQAMTEVILGEFDGTLGQKMHKARRAAKPVRCEQGPWKDDVPVDVHMGNLEVWYTAKTIQDLDEGRVGARRRKLLLNAVNGHEQDVVVGPLDEGWTPL